MSDEELADLDDDAKAALQNGEVHDASDHDDDEDYGEKVRKRIGKEVGRRKALESELERERTERARLEQEIADSRKKLSSYEEQQDSDLKTKSETLKDRRDKALDEGDLTTYNELNDELMEVRLELRQRSSRPRPQDDDGEQGGQQRRGAPGASDASRDWVSANRDWLQADEGNIALAKSIEGRLARKYGGYSNPKLYQELSEQLAKVADDYQYEGAGYDEIEVDDDPPPRRPNSAGVPRNGDAPNARPRGNRLTREDLNSMSRYGFDPESPADRKAWLNRNAEL